MATRQDYDIVLRATDQTAAGFLSAKKNLEQLNGAIGALEKGVGGLAGLFVGDQIAEFAKSAVESFSQIGEASKRVGVTSDALQALRFEATQNGAQLEDADAALEKFASQISKAGTASDYLGKVLQANGVALKGANGQIRSASDLLQDYARLVANAGSQQDRIRLSVEAFGRGAGPLMVGTLDAIARDGLQGVIDKGKELGVIADRNLIDKAEQIDKRWKQISTTFGTTVKGALVSVIDEISVLSDKYFKATEQFEITRQGGNFQVGSDMLKQGLGTQLKSATDFYDSIFRGSAKKTVLPLDNDALQKQIDSVSKHVAQMKADAQAIDATAGAHEALRVELQLEEVAQQHGISTAGEFGKKIQDIATKAGDAADAFAKAKLQSDVFFERSQLGRSPVEQTVADRLRSAKVAADSAAGQELANQIRINETLKTSEDLATSFADNFTQSMLQGKSATDSLKGALTNLESQLISMIEKQLINQAFGGLIGGFFPSGGGILPGGAAAGQGGIGHAAGGGNFSAGDWSWVGETGKELVRFGSDATVIPARESAAMTAPASIGIKIVNNGPPLVDEGASYDDNGELELTVRAVTRDEMASGRTNGIQRNKYGQAPRLKSRG